MTLGIPDITWPWPPSGDEKRSRTPGRAKPFEADREPPSSYKQRHTWNPQSSPNIDSRVAQHADTHRHTQTHTHTYTHTHTQTERQSIFSVSLSVFISLCLLTSEQKQKTSQKGIKQVRQVRTSQTQFKTCRTGKKKTHATDANTILQHFMTFENHKMS